LCGLSVRRRASNINVKNVSGEDVNWEEEEEEEEESKCWLSKLSFSSV
jgi:hypothetical protein